MFKKRKVIKEKKKIKGTFKFLILKKAAFYLYRVFLFFFSFWFEPAINQLNQFRLYNKHLELAT